MFVIVVFASITDDFLASYPGYTIKVYAYGQNRSPISNPYFIDNGFEMEDVVQTDLIGRASAVDDVTVSVNPVTMKAEIKGVLEATAPRTAWVNVSVGGVTKDVAIGYCDEDGNFTAEYDFANEEIASNGADFLFAVSAIGMNGQNAVSKRLFDADAFAGITDEILALDKEKYALEIKEIDAYAQSHGVELIPCVQTLAHLSGLALWSDQYINDFCGIAD